MPALPDTDPTLSLPAVLACWEIPPVQATEAIEASRTVFKITTAGPVFLLKDVTGTLMMPRLVFTRAVLAHVARSGLQVPVPLLSRSGEIAVPVAGRHYLLSEYIQAGEPASDPTGRAELFYQTGQAIAELHTALASYPDPDIGRQTWRFDPASGVSKWLATLSAGLPAEQAAVVRQIQSARGSAIEAALRGLPEQLIHRDCHPGNVLVDGTRVIGFIDFDHLCLGPPLFDLASYAVHHLKWQTDNAAGTRLWLAHLPRLVQGYRARHSLPPAEAAALPHVMLVYHLLLSDWFLSLPQLESIDLEIRALAWLHANFDRITDAVASSEIA